jgi:predicted aspartyl protease
MGVFRVPIEAGDPSGQSYESVDAMVDTGATNTMLPRQLQKNSA